MASLAFV